MTYPVIHSREEWNAARAPRGVADEHDFGVMRNKSWRGAFLSPSWLGFKDSST